MKTSRPILAAVALAAAAIAPAAATGPQQSLESINGTELYVQRMGSGEPVIVVHGGPVMEHGYLLPHLAPLADTYELVFYDQRLSGRSAGTVDPESVRIATFVEDIEQLRQKLGLGRVHLVAHSWGGLLAIHYALRYGDQLRSLVLLSSMSVSSDLWQQEEARIAERISDQDREASQRIRESAAFAARSPEAIRQLLLLSFRPQFHDLSRAAELQLYVPDDYMARSQQFGAMMVDLESFDLHAGLVEIAVPTLLVYGSAEPGAALGGTALHAGIPDSQLVLIDGAGHFPFIEQPAAFLDAVRGFLAGTGTGKERP